MNGEALQILPMLQVMADQIPVERSKSAQEHPSSFSSRCELIGQHKLGTIRMEIVHFVQRPCSMSIEKTFRSAM